MLGKNIMGNAFEGESYVGKTSSIEALKEMEELRESGIIAVPEYSVIGKLPEFPRVDKSDIKKAVQGIIDLEKRRTDKLVKDLESNKNGEVFFDRGPISCLAFEYAAEKHGYKGATLWLAEEFQRAFEDKNIIIPAGMIYLMSPRNVIEEREKKHTAQGHSKILDFLKDREVIETMNGTFKMFRGYLPKQFFIILDTGNKKPQEVGADVLQFITNQPKDVLEHKLDFISFAHSLIKKSI